MLHFAGKVDPKHSKESFGEIADGLAKTGLNSPLPAELARSIEGGAINIWIGAEDHLVRRERVEFRYSGGEATYDFRRGAINEPQQISAPANAKSSPQAVGDRDSLGLAFTALVTAVFAVEPAGGRSEAQPQRSESRRQALGEPAPAEPRAAAQARSAGGAPARRRSGAPSSRAGS